MSGAEPFPDGVGVRPVTLTDVPAFLAVMQAAGMDPRSSWSRTSEADLYASLFGPGAGGYLAVVELAAGGLATGGPAVGCVGYRPDGLYTLTLNKLATRPEVRAQGVGRQLVAQVEAAAVQGGYRRVLLAVSVFNLDVLPFYTRLGYTITDEPYAHANPASPAPVVLVKPLTRGHD